MQEKFLQFINENNLCNKSNKILLGVSGGIDSICMFHLFQQLEFQISIAHCNFQLRGEESNKDEIFVKQLANNYNIPFHSTKFDTTRIAQENGISIQMAARDLRYEWFSELLDTYEYDYIAIAHNKDDVIETFLINLSRGSGIKGLSGIKSKYGNVIRPLLFASRKNIEQYIVENNYDYREDSSNNSTKYSRNLIRHEIIPAFEKINPSFRETMIQNIERLNQTEKIYNYSISNNLKDVTELTNNGLIINIGKLKQLQSTTSYLHELLYQFGFTKSQTQDIANSLDGISGKKFLTETHRLIKDRNELIIEEIKANLSTKYYINSINDELNYPIKIDLSSIIIDNSFSINIDPDIALFDINLIEFPLTLRKWEKGDYFSPLGMSNLKKVSDFFIDSKLSISEKENTWILESAGKIVWIVGKRIDNRFKITTKTKEVLKLKTSNVEHIINSRF
jgi:tRNA(Ile)-lysidine synthase